MKISLTKYIVASVISLFFGLALGWIIKSQYPTLPPIIVKGYISDDSVRAQKPNEYHFNLLSETNEFAWRDNLKEKLGGKKETPTKYGRIDLETENYVIEVEFINKWHEGIGQAIHYSC